MKSLTESRMKPKLIRTIRADNILRKKSFWIIFVCMLLAVFYQIQFYIFPVSIKYDKYDVKVNATLTSEESKNIKEILKNAEPAGLLSCGFGFDVTVRIGTRVYLLARDSCASYQHLFRFYDISGEDMDYIHDIFEKYGGAGFHS